MKLTELRVAIRNYKGNPTISVPINGVAVDIPIQKTAFMDTLGLAFADHPDGRAAETGIEFEDGHLHGLTQVVGEGPETHYDAEDSNFEHDDAEAYFEDDDLDI